MPQDQVRPREHDSCPPAGENANDKRSSSKLLRLLESTEAEDSSERRSSCSLEKDSGYSEFSTDGSDSQHTDFEEQQSQKGQSRGSKNAQRSENQQPGLKNAGKVPSMPAGWDPSPVYNIKDMVLKQPGIIQIRDQLLWNSGTKDGKLVPSPPNALLSQPTLIPASFQIHRPLSRRSNVYERKMHGSHLPIPNSFPRVCPNPSKKQSEISSSSDSQRGTQGACADVNVVAPPVTASLQDQPAPEAPSSSNSAATASPSQGSLTTSHLRHTLSSFITKGHHKDVPPNARHRRFVNTVEILRQSGLLDITLRTKQLLRQSNATGGSITQLRQHTQLLSQAANNLSARSEEGVTWVQLYRNMAESGCYPGLKSLQSFQSPPTGSGSVPSGAHGEPRLAEGVGVSQSKTADDVSDQKAGEESPAAASASPPDTPT